MKRILVYSSLSVLTAIGTAFTAANAEIFEGEETTPTAIAQLTSDASASASTAVTFGNPSLIGQVPETAIPTEKPSAATPVTPAPDADAGLIEASEPDADSVETLSPVPGAMPLSPVPANGVVPATPTPTPLGSPVLPAAPGTAPVETESEADLETESEADLETESEADLETESDPETEATLETEDNSTEGDSLDAMPAEAPLEDPTVDEAPIQEEMETEGDLMTPSAPNGFTPSAPDSNFTPSAPNGITPSAPDGNFAPSTPNGFTPAAPNGVTPLTPEAPPVDSPAPATPSAPLPPSPSAPTEALPPINDSFDNDGFNNNEFNNNEFNESTPLGSTSDRLIGEGFSPFQLSYLAIGGGLKEVGIPGGNQLLSAYESGDLSAEDIVAAGAMTKRLGTAANDEADYTKGVDKFLQLLSREGLNS